MRCCLPAMTTYSMTIVPTCHPSMVHVGGWQLFDNGAIIYGELCEFITDMRVALRRWRMAGIEVEGVALPSHFL